ncbi:HutD family protein [Streptomyces sp. NPDC087917]|uniref:HutD/Ves family protein n=1 Tax=Streptomyces sp. NPDC087917 TaxID=3155060 RepID=UPI003427F116
MSTGPADIRILRAADRPATVWKNGGGVTREIAAGPEGSDMAGFAWRVSFAEVAADGPFSEFPGVDRVLTLVEGAGMDLTVAGEHRLVDERFAPQAFPGDRPTGCRLLAGPVVNFNVMCRRETARARTAVVRGELALDTTPGETLLIVALDAPALLDPAGPGPEGAVVLAPYDAVLTGGPGPLPPRMSLRTEGRAAVVRIG